MIINMDKNQNNKLPPGTDPGLIEQQADAVLTRLHFVSSTELHHGFLHSDRRPERDVALW